MHNARIGEVNRCEEDFDAINVGRYPASKFSYCKTRGSYQINKYLPIVLCFLADGVGDAIRLAVEMAIELVSSYGGILNGSHFMTWSAGLYMLLLLKSP